MKKSWNPRYIAYAKSQGRTPEEQRVHDKREWPGGLMCGFTLWMNGKWREFCQMHKVKNPPEARLKLGEECDRIFDFWLNAR